MQATRFWVLAWLASVGSVAVLSCGSDEATSHPPASAGEAGTPSSPFANGGQAGDSAGGSSANGGNLERGGDGMGASAGEPSPHAGGVGGVPGAAGAGGGGPPTGDGEQLELCARLSGVVDLADSVTRAYAKATNGDCAVKWVIPRTQAPLIAFRNELVIWSLDFWGCQGAPVDTFALVYDAPALSPGDVTLLVDHYMTAAQSQLDLSPGEFEEMQAALRRLATPLITGSSTEPSNPQCLAVGGAGGNGPGAAGSGAGGTPETGGIGGDLGLGGIGGAP
jgi:hypothetical protein